MADRKDAIRAVQGALGTKQDVVQWKTATMGDGKGTVSTGNNMCYVRLTENSSVIEVLNLRCMPIDGLRVRIAKTPEMPLVWQVIGQDDQRVDENGSSVGVGFNYSVPNHAALHRYLAPDQVDIDWRQITNLRVYHSSALAAFTIGVLSGIIPRAGADLVVNSQTLDLTSYKPAAGALYCLISIDSAGALAVTAGATKVDRASLTVADIPDTPTGNFRLAAVRLYSGQPFISESTSSNDIRDLRWPQERLATGITADQLAIGNYKIVAVSGGDYTDVQSAITALSATGGLVEIMAGTYTSTSITMAAGVNLFSAGAVTLATTSGTVLNAPASGSCVVRGIQLYAGGGGAAVTYPAASTAALVFADSRISHVSGSYGIDASAADATAELTLSHFNVISNSGGISTKAITRLTNAQIDGAVVQAASAGALTVESGYIAGALTITTTATLRGMPRVGGTVTGTPTGNYTNSTGQIVSSIATGTAPVSVASTTLNSNFNADKWDSLDAPANASGYLSNNGAGVLSWGAISSPLYYDTEANILAATKDAGTIAVSSDTYYLFQSLGSGTWRKSTFRFQPEGSNPDMGFLPPLTDKSRIGYGETYITDKTIVNSAIGSNANSTEGSIKEVAADGFYGYISGVYNKFVTGFRFREVAGTYYLEHQPISGGDWIIVESGNSERLGLNGLPSVQGYHVSMGAYPPKLVISGGTF